MTRAEMAVKDATDFVALVVHPPMRNPNRRKRAVILALRGKAARVFEQIRQPVYSGSR
jgi:hypothetical protein